MAVFVVALAFSGCRGQSDRTVIIFTAASTSDAIDEIKAEFHEQSGIEVTTSYASSSTLAQQIVNGADADVFLIYGSNLAKFRGRFLRAIEKRSFEDRTMRYEDVRELMDGAVPAILEKARAMGRR